VTQYCLDDPPVDTLLLLYIGTSYFDGAGYIDIFAPVEEFKIGIGNVGSCLRNKLRAVTPF
jgi:hypothetical protein